MRHFCLALLIAFGLFGTPAFADELDRFIGTFVGVTEVFDGEGHKAGDRDVDMIIEKAKNRGFTIKLVSVALVDGRRDLPGVRHRTYSATFEPSDTDGMYLAANPFNPFEESTSSEMFEGKPLEWAQLTETALTVHTLTILEDGRYESQVFERAFEGDVMLTFYERKLDGDLKRRTEGRMVRSD
ncbi:MAG: hypothetical protein AAF619_02420 [Pseudomonadota bacterium]